MALLPPDAAQTLHFALHWNVVYFAAALSLGTGLLFGLFPALQSTKPDLVTTLRAGSGKLAGVRSAARFRNSLVTVQIALSMALLVSAGLFVKSLRNVSRVNLGIKTENVVTFGLSPELNGYTHARSHQFFGQVEDALAAIPGVDDVSSALVPVLAGNSWGSDVSVQGFKKGPDTDANARFNEVGPGYFKTMGMPLSSGREFTRPINWERAKVASSTKHLPRNSVSDATPSASSWATSGDDSLNIQIVGSREGRELQST